MSLTEYHAKRQFDHTPEPTGGEANGRLRFVIQKHDATALHYDFRLEMGGILKSWAIPKGPSLDPKTKHLAMMTEDHPYDYQYFEGIIPKDNYGAGPVMIWDEGTYEPLAWDEKTGQTLELSREEQDKHARHGVHQEHLTFILHGKKLNGEFALVKIKHPTNAKDNAWLIVKAHKDRFVSEDDVTKQDRSVITNRTLEEIAANAPITTLRFDELDSSPTGTMPSTVKPMLATLAEEPFDSPDWVYEIKWDGYRILAQLENHHIKLLTRGAQDYTERFKPVVEALNVLNVPALFDGEVSVVDEEGRVHFQDLQNYMSTGQGRLLYCLFDLLHLDGHDLTALPLLTRKLILQRLLGLIHNPHLQYSSHVREQGTALFATARDQNIEGLMAKLGSSPYQPGRRSRDWLKLKTHRRQEAVIVGYTEPRARRQYFGSLVLGLYDAHGQLHYAGHSGSGFTEATLKDTWEHLQPLKILHSPITPAPKTNEPAQWVKPQLVAEIEFTEWTDDGSMRHPIFVGLREDKPAIAVHREDELKVKKGTSMNHQHKAQHSQSGQDDAVQDKLAGNTKIPRSSSDPTESAKQTSGEPEDAKLKLEGHPVHLTHLNKIYWPDSGITKGELLEYYQSVAEVMLPYLKDRPQSLHRFPGGITEEGFYQKDVENHPDWVNSVKIHSESTTKDINFVLCQNEATMLYLINLGCIELNPWNSRAQHLEKPDWCVIDLDPEDIGFEAVIEVAQAVHAVLEELHIPSYPKTSGATGLHIYIPMGAQYDYEQVKTFANLIVQLVQPRVPNITSIERKPEKRPGKVYLDYLQNRYGQTLAAAYSVRPRPGATVSMPLDWTEVTAGLSPHQFTIKNAASRLGNDTRLWKPILGTGINLKSILAKLN